MILEAFFSTVASNVLTEIVKQIFGKKRLNEKEIEKIVESTIQKYHVAGQASVLQKEIIMILGNTGIINATGQVPLLPYQIPEPSQLLGAWWDKRVYKIVSVFSEKAVSVLDWRTEDGAPIVQWDYLEGANQQWKVIPVGGQDNLFKIHSCYSAKVLDVPDPRMEDRTAIIQWGYHGGTNQLWRLHPIDKNTGVFKITSEWSGKSLDVPDPRTDNGVPLIQWSYHGRTNQQWRLMQVK